jgi:catechol 2,3-dioxygenase-like lactoylglutathione lyase family enzyme
MNVSEIDHLVINVGDVERSLAWYTDMLGLVAERVDEWRAGQVSFPSVRVNDRFIIDLMALDRTGQNIDHICLVVDRDDVDDVVADSRFDIVEGPVARWGAKGVGRSVYVTDPDGNQVELRSYD